MSTSRKSLRRPHLELLEPRLLLSSVVISEFMAVNDTTLADADGDYPDWIELHNFSDAGVDLAGWSLTDDAGELDKWVFPAVTIPAWGNLVIFASDKDRADPAGELHTGFKLSGPGEYLALVRPDQTIAHDYWPQFPQQMPDVSYGLFVSVSQQVLLPAGAPVRTHVPTDDSLEQTWFLPEFDDTGWAAGTGGVGFETETGYEALIGADVGAEMFGVQASAYARWVFQVDNPAAVADLDLHIRYDDGFAVYVNGREVARRNVPDTLVWDSPATASHPDGEAVVAEEVDISDAVDYLVSGTNVLAIRALNVSASDPDLLVAPELVAAVTSAPDPDVHRYFVTPTPGSINGAGVADLGPMISQVGHTPNVPADSQDIIVTATVSATFDAVGTVTLFYRVMYGSEVATAMFDDGAHGDGAAGNGVYGAIIPASASTPGEMVRYYIHADDTEANPSRWPLFTDPTGSPEYLGTVVADPGIDSQLPVYHWFVADPPAANTDAGTRASLFHDGEFYDNIFVRIRGGTARGYYKKNYKFDFNKGHWFRWDDGQQRVSEINLNSTWADKAYVRQVLSFETFRDAGSPYSEAFHVRLDQNGQFFSIANYIEQVDEQYMERQGFDPNGALYKMVSGHVPGSVHMGLEKKTRRDENYSDLQEFYDGLRLSGDALLDFLYENADVPEIVNYYAAMVLVSDGDHVYKNHYLYRDSDGTGLWSVLPWDKDLVFGRGWSGTQGVLNDIIRVAGDPINGWWMQNWLANAIMSQPVTRQMYLRRVRTLMDELLQPPGTPANELKFENRIDELVALMGDDVALDAARWRPYDYGSDQDIATAVDYLKTGYLAPSRTYLAGLGHIPSSQVAPAITFGHIEYDPPTGNQNHEYIEIVNDSAYAVDISGWRLADGIDFTFAGGTVIPANTTLYVTPDLMVFRNRPMAPRGGQGLFVVGDYDRHIGIGGEAIRLLDKQGAQVDVFVTPGVEINEVMYAPEGTQQQWIELHNPTDEPSDISGWYLSDDPASPAKYRIPDGVSLPAGAYRMFTWQGGFGAHFTLGAEGGRVVLSSADDAGVVTAYRREVSFGFAQAGVSAGWHVRSDGQADFVLLSAPTPGAPNADPRVSAVVINELMYAPEAGGDEFIELTNASDSAWPLYDPAHPTHTWRIGGGVSYDFPVGVEILPGELVLVVGIDLSSPAAETAFRSQYGIAGDVRIFGPYSGDLDNGGDNVELLAPGGSEPVYYAADRVEYLSQRPWPAAAGGEGPSLERVDPTDYGNDPANWQATHDGGSPGVANVSNPNPPDVNAGADFGVPDSDPTAQLDGTASDDGMPLGSVLTAIWSFVSGPGEVAFEDVHDLRTTVTFEPAPGSYVLRLTASDGHLSRWDEVTVLVGPALVLSAGADRTSGRKPVTANFTSSVAGGLPGMLGRGSYQLHWDFGDGTASSSMATPTHRYDSHGVYDARLTVYDGASTASAVVTIVVGGLPGDANGDGRVGLSDLLIVADHYGQEGVAWRDGDFTDDGRVTLSDLLALADNYGRSVEDAAATTAVAAARPALIASLADTPAPATDPSFPADDSLTAPADIDLLPHADDSVAFPLAHATPPLPQAGGDESDPDPEGAELGLDILTLTAPLLLLW